MVLHDFGGQVGFAQYEAVENQPYPRQVDQDHHHFDAQQAKVFTPTAKRSTHRPHDDDAQGNEPPSKPQTRRDIVFFDLPMHIVRGDAGVDQPEKDQRHLSQSIKDQGRHRAAPLTMDSSRNDHGRSDVHPRLDHPGTRILVFDNLLVDRKAGQNDFLIDQAGNLEQEDTRQGIPPYGKEVQGQIS